MRVRRIPFHRLINESTRRENVFERPERALSILAALKVVAPLSMHLTTWQAKSTIFTIVPPRTYSLEPIERVHNKECMNHLILHC